MFSGGYRQALQALTTLLLAIKMGAGEINKRFSQNARH